MPRIVTAEQLRDDLDAELEALRGTNVAALTTREDRAASIPWRDLREPTP